MLNIDEQMLNQFFNGTCTNLYDYFGAHQTYDENNQPKSVIFRVYAPNARTVYLKLSHDLKASETEMHKISHHGIFELEVFGVFEFTSYLYEIHTKDYQIVSKTDPFSTTCQIRPDKESLVYDLNGYTWHDQKWVNKRNNHDDQPLLIYEMHFGSWMREHGEPLSYEAMVDPLIKYLLEQGYTHVEFLPMYEYPLDDSWGYQGTVFYSATSRYGLPKALMHLVDELHKAGIGVIFDWVLGHISRDWNGLSFFDGTPLYEYDDPNKRENAVWGTNNLDFSKGITRSFMLSALNFWIDTYHVDGFRIDAVANLIYYLGDANQGVNQEAVDFIKEVTEFIIEKDPTLLFMAEDSTAYPKVTHPVNEDGLGFTHKWNMGFMNDVLGYFREDPIFRKYHHHKITFGLVYAFNEKFILPFSHDEVVHVKGSLVNKMPGTYEQKIAGWKTLLTLWITHPGKKLLFMGQEFAQFSEWAFQSQIDWYLFEDDRHVKANQFFKDLVKIYKSHNALYQYDFIPKGFRWSVIDDTEQSVFAYLRYSDDETLLIILNMTPNVHESYEIGVPYEGEYIELINSDRKSYGGNDHINTKALQTKKGQRKDFDYYIKPKLGPLSAMIFKYNKK